MYICDMNSRSIYILVLLFCIVLFFVITCNLYPFSVVFPAAVVSLGLIISQVKTGIFCAENLPPKEVVVRSPRHTPEHLKYYIPQIEEQKEEESNTTTGDLQKKITPKQFFNLSEKEQMMYKIVNGGFEEKKDEWGNVYFEQETYYILKGV